ncbi:hypothetical protein V5799_009671 [Amblyomma americanum]|uniref:Uncharacterized protein n=1 Tax=Amblyomma americanum TaxID=6943 RepID=A0AAQ4F9U5_AMBAM
MYDVTFTRNSCEACTAVGPACGEAGTEPENEVFQEKGMETPNWSCGVGLQNIGLSVAGVWLAWEIFKSLLLLL